MSGIPFGLSSDLLEKPNPWRGMLFGMTNRALYSGPLPTPIWKQWDTFGIEDAAMIGWWNRVFQSKPGAATCWQPSKTGQSHDRNRKLGRQNGQHPLSH